MTDWFSRPSDTPAPNEDDVEAEDEVTEAVDAPPLPPPLTPPADYVAPPPAPPAPTYHSTVTSSVPPPRWNDPSPMPRVEPVADPEPEVVAAFDEPPAPTIESLPVPEAPIVDDDVAEVDLPTMSATAGLRDEVLFDLTNLSTEERRHLSMRLTGAGISHRFEVATDLIVGLADADVIESYLDEVQNPDAFETDELDAFESDEDVDDEAVYSAMSNLYVAADKLMQKPDDGATQNEFFNASDDVEGLPAPFGFDPRVWQQVLGLASSIAAAMDAVADDDKVAEDARTLRQLLVNYV